MPISHSLSMTTPDNAAFENKPSDWNNPHYISLVGSEVVGAFSNAGNISFGLDGGGYVTASANVTAAPSPVNVTGANGSSVNAQTIAFSNANGMSLGVSTAANGATITGSYTVPTQTVQTQASGAIGGSGFTSAGANISISGTNNSAGLSLSLSVGNYLTTAALSNHSHGASGANGSFAFQTLSFSNANGVSFATSAGSAIVGSVATTYRASNDALGLNTAGSNVTWTANSSGVSLDARGYAGTATAITGKASITLNSAGLSFNGAGLAGTTSGFTGANISATITHDTAGIAMSMSVAGAGGAASQTLYATGNTTINSSGVMALSSLLMRGYGVVSLGTSNGSILVSSPDPVDFTYFSAGNSNLGNTAGDTGVFSQRLVLVGSNNITLSGSSNGGSATISIIGGAGGAGLTVSDNATSLSVSRLAFTQSNGITMSLSTAAGAATVIASHNGLTSQSNQNALAANGNFNFQTLSFSNAQGVSFATSAGSAIVASVETSYAASNHSHGNPTLALTNISGTTASASNGLTLSLSVAAATSMSVSDAGTSGTLARLAFTNLNGVTLSLSTGAGGSHTIVGSHNALTSQSNQNITAANGGFAFQTLSFSNVNGFSFGTSAGSAITGSYTVPAVTDYFSKTNTTFNGANISGSMTLNTNGLQMSLSVAAPGAAAENNAIALLGNNTSGNTTATGSTIGWSGVNVTLSGTNASQVIISAPATSSLVGASGLTVSSAGSTISVGQVLGSYFDNMNGIWPNSTTMLMNQSTSHIQQFVLNEPISYALIRIPMTGSLQASTTAATTGNSQFSYGLTRSHNFVLYARGTGGSSMSLMSVGSTQLTDQQSINVSANANSTQFSYSNRASFQMSTGVQGYTFDYSSSAASLNFHTSGMTAISGNKMMEFSWGSSLTPGQYWLMYGVSSSSTSQFNANGSRLFNVFSNYGASQPAVSFGTIGADTNNSIGVFYGNGSFSTAGGGTTANLPISAVTTTAAHNKMVFMLNRIA